jgi:2-polyprenyl-6-hydroxyphenyl methylase/3-demethylubiquinone-9 3-methyltransferase
MEPASTTTDAQAVERGARSEVGKSKARFLASIDDDRIDEACKSLRRMLGVESLARRKFLDAGSGGGLFSLAAMKLSAERVVSFDADPEGVACARELKRRFFPAADNWTIEQGSVLDESYLERLGLFEVVCSWGVLHHTGKLWQALANVAGPVAPGGRLFIALYRDQGWLSELWLRVKQVYNVGLVGRAAVLGVFVPLAVLGGLLGGLVRGRGARRGKGGRGLSRRLRDWVDWLGALPFEVASAPAVLAFYKQRHFRLENLGLSDGRGCNEFVFSRSGTIPPLPLREPAKAAP